MKTYVDRIYRQCQYCLFFKKDAKRKWMGQCLRFYRTSNNRDTCKDHTSRANAYNQELVDKRINDK